MSERMECSREFSAQILEYVRGKGKILIVAHDNPDPDSLAAAFALRQLFEVKENLTATITFGGIIGRGENRAMVEGLEIKAVPLEQLDLNQFGVVCMVDTQPGTGNNSFPADRKVHIVIDHHPLREQTRECALYDVREEYGAAATVLYEYLLAQEIYIGTKLATILYYAIKSETQDLGREWTQYDKTAYLNLLQLSNNRILYDIAHSQVPREYFTYYNRAIENARLYGSVMVFNLYDVDNPDVVAEMADFLLRMQEVEVVLGMGRFREKEILSLRTSSHDILAGKTMQQVVDKLGTAGGHGMVAGAQIAPMKGNRSVLHDLEKTLTRRLLTALERPLVKSEPLVCS
ncbi:MAG: phosphoesterase [Desulfuromonas sp.]|nr:MAG: phosphoesterase [Desulfuromonas sp.]